MSNEPMTLPKTTIDKIKADAVAYVEKTRGQQGRVETYQAGATEWAGKAEEHLIPALEWIRAFGKDNPERMIECIDNALAKYKEVGND
jgi:hypothetical protein